MVKSARMLQLDNRLLSLITYQARCFLELIRLSPEESYIRFHRAIIAVHLFVGGAPDLNFSQLSS